MTRTSILAAAALVVGSGLTLGPAQAQQTGIGRTETLRHDLGNSGREVVQVRVDFAPGASFPKHTHPGEEIAYVLEGAMEYQLGDQPPVTLKVGDALFIPAGTAHSAKNVGDVNASELATYLLDKGKPVLTLSK